MFTECPTCNTVFRVQPEQLAAARGKVRCGECLAVFDAREYLREDLEEPTETAPEAPVPNASETQATLPLEMAPPEPRPEVAPPHREPPKEAPRSERVEVRRRPAPVEPLLPLSPSPRRMGRWLVLNLLLLLALAGQYFWFQRTELSAIPGLRPVLTLLCGPGACAPAMAGDHFTLTSRAVQSHPAYEQALLIDATFVNSSDAPQPYPGLELVFTDPEETALASRRFQPKEYLGHAPQQPLAPGAEAHVVLELLDPGDLAVGYEFRFF